MSIEMFVRDRALVFLSKNRDYGDSFYESMQVFPDAGKVRILDKVNRLKSLLKNKGLHEVDETMQDTLLDLFNYGTMHFAIKEAQSYNLDTIIEVMYSWAEFPHEFTSYINSLLTKDDINLGLSDIEKSYVNTVINDLVAGG